MKKLQTMLALLLISLPAFLWAQDSRFSVEPQYPQQGEKIKVSFNPKGTELEAENNISAIVYWTEKNGLKVHEMPMTKSGSAFIGSYDLEKTATALAFTFIAGDKQDNNDRKGYVIPVYDDKKQLVPFANKALYKLYGDWDAHTVGLNRVPETGQPYMEKEYKEHPENIKENFADYFASLKAIKKADLNDIILAEGAKVEAAGNLTEDQLSMLNYWYNQAKHIEKAEAIYTKMRELFPNGTWKKNEAARAIYNEKNAAKREAMTQAYLKDFNIEPAKSGAMKWQVASAYAEEKNWDKFNELVKDIDMQTLARNYNEMAWEWAEKDENLDMAKKLSKQTLDYAKLQIDKPTGEKPVTRTAKQWEQDRKSTYAMFADTYAYILFKQKDYKNAFSYAKEAVDIKKRKVASYNDRYALLLEQVAPAAQIKKELEVMVKDGAAGVKTREVLQRSYVKVNKSDKGWDAYIAGLDAAQLEKLKESLKKEMLSKNAPTFRLVNMQGTEVDFASLKGKVVILDFWATWCGPCIASFPSMQKMVEKYKNNKDVVFLFIDTWENTPEREKLVQQFIDKHKYTFNVLYDKQKEPGSNEFTVVKDYEVEGIPTKFIVDVNGQIRFISLGWGGNEHTFMQELDLMIEMAGQGGSGIGTSDKKGF